jgi:mannan endo-1,4-beta-mannosidase
MRRVATLLVLGLVSLASGAPDPVGGFVSVKAGHFVREGRPWFVRGANLWYGAYLGRPSNPAGRERLIRELDRLRDLGVNNLRMLASSDLCAVARTVRPAIQTAPGVYDEDVLQGLDFVLAEAGRRGMTAVLFISNNWDWSGGMPQLLSWATGRPALGVDTAPWKEWNRVESTFYENRDAMDMYARYARMILARTNTVTGVAYRDDPTIMAWELANEPRPGEREGDNDRVFAHFMDWVQEASALLHACDRHHLVTTGTEGFMGCMYDYDKVRRVHAVQGIDYLVFHLWPKNWGWFDAAKPQETLEPALAKAREYVDRHIAVAAALGKPCVVEEFGMDRDGGFTADRTTASRDRLYAQVFGQIQASIASGGAAAGSNFWIWGGEGRPPLSSGARDGIGAGDMPQEKPGLNTVFDSDSETLGILRRHFAVLRSDEQGPAGR